MIIYDIKWKDKINKYKIESNIISLYFFGCNIILLIFDCKIILLKYIGCFFRYKNL